MKSLHFISMIVLITCVLCQGCKPGEIELRLRPPHNSQYNLVFSTDGRVSMNVAGKDIGTDIHSKVASLLQVDTLPNDRYSFSLTYDDYDMKQTINGKEIDLKQLPSDSTGNVKHRIELIKGITFRSVMTASGKTEQLQGSDSIMSRLDSSMKEMPEQARKQVLATLSPLLNSDIAKGMLEQCFYVLPHEKVNIGDSWHNEIVMQSVFSMVIKSTYTLIQIKDGKAEVKVHAVIKPGNPEVMMPGLAMAAPKGSNPNPEQGGLDLMGMKMKASFEGTQEGTVWINVATGMVIKNQLNQDLAGKISISILDLPMTMKVVTRYDVEQVQ
jgi:hypothetical protein